VNQIKIPKNVVNRQNGDFLVVNRQRDIPIETLLAYKPIYQKLCRSKQTNKKISKPKVLVGTMFEGLQLYKWIAVDVI